MKCIECDNMACKVFHVKSVTWEGYCMKLRRAVNGLDPCRYNYELSLFGD